MMITWYSHDLTCTSPFLLAACEADLLFPITNEGSVSSIPCSQIHPSFNPFGVAVSTCPVLRPLKRGIQQELASRVSDFSQCTFNTEANSHVVFIRITIIRGQGRFPFYSAEQNMGLIMSEVLNIHTHTCIHTHTHTHTHTYTHTHSHAHTHTHTQSLLSSPILKRGWKGMHTMKTVMCL